MARPMRSLPEWLTHIESLDPSRIELGLDRIRTVWDRLKVGPIEAKVITVTGTNGKGTCCTALDCILRHSGAKVGRYTSPHIREFNERIMINGEMAISTDLVDAFERVESVREKIDLTYFEFTTLVCLDLFQRSELDYWVLEVGLGGRLDAVNVVDADLAVVTSVGLDHMDWLGETLHAVAQEKAGIFREGIPVVLGQANLPAVVKRKASELNCPIFQNTQQWEAYLETTIGKPTGWSWQGKGSAGKFKLLTGLPYHQLNLDSLGCAVQAAYLINPEVTDSAIVSGIEFTQLRGRWETVQTSKGVEIVLDVAHNPAAGFALRGTLKQNPVVGKTFCVLGMLNDKQHMDFIGEIAPVVDTWFLTNPGGSRSWDAQHIQESLLPQALVFPTPELALANAVTRAREGDRVLVTGSFLTVEAVMDSEFLQ